MLLAAPAWAGTLLTLSTAPQPPPGYRSLPYANAAAPKGGSFTIATIGDFDNLNPFILAGSAPESIYRVWQPLFKPSDADSVTAYADLAQSADISADGRTVTFHLNPAARFSDGATVTAADVVWTYKTLISQGAPIYAALYGGVTAATALDNETAMFRFAKSAGRAQLLNLAEMYILPAHAWAGKNFAAPLRDLPIGSGPYRVARVAFGDEITYTRVPNWWAARNPADAGFDNFQTFTERYFRTDLVALQAFKARELDARIEHSDSLWPGAYQFPVPAGAKLALEDAPLSLPAGIHGLVMNTRRPLFADPRVREALGLAFDFAWANRVFFHGAQRRETSYFTNSTMADPASAPPPGDADATGDNLPQLRQAFALLAAAGWRVQNFRLVNGAGQNFSFEILLPGPADEPLILAYQASLAHLGLDAAIRILDPAAYQRRLQTFDFDMTTDSIPATDYPDSEQAAYWGCAAARAPGSLNLAGLCSPAIEAAIAAGIAAPDLAAKTAAIHALDRLLQASFIFIPWGVPKAEHLAYWADRMSHPAAPLQNGVDFDLWWAK